MSQKGLSIWLRILDALLIVGLLISGLVILPLKAIHCANIYPDLAWLFWPCLVFGWVLLIGGIAIALLAWSIFTEIGKDNSFSRKNATSLKRISIIAAIEALLLFVAILVYMLALGLGPLGAILILALFSITCFTLCIVAAALSHLTLKAAELQEDNDLVI